MGKTLLGSLFLSILLMPYVGMSELKALKTDEKWKDFVKIRPGLYGTSIYVPVGRDFIMKETPILQDNEIIVLNEGRVLVDPNKLLDKNGDAIQKFSIKDNSAFEEDLGNFFESLT